MRSKLLQLMSSYLPQGKLNGNILVFEPAKALEVADDLNKIGVGIVAIELWYWVEFEGKQYLAEDAFGPEFDKLLKEPDGVNKSVQAAKRYLEHDLPERIVYVSYVLDTDERYWEIWEDQLKQIAKAG